MDLAARLRRGSYSARQPREGLVDSDNKPYTSQEGVLLPIT